eukprot:TRINITY_DN321_c1_g1_i1.p1 TRINITY_DN321_c1_g1~~TRINITY_DN321_c1_g1_i1.p1  ORF type:complete len:429 (-),score=86.60 TRINITY_DN321_c1_g1_i1:71-1282(-)
MAWSQLSGGHSSMGLPSLLLFPLLRSAGRSHFFSRLSSVSSMRHLSSKTTIDASSSSLVLRRGLVTALAVSSSSLLPVVVKSSKPTVGLSLLQQSNIHTYSFVNLSQNPERFMTAKPPMKKAAKLYLLLAAGLILYCLYKIDKVPFSGRYHCVLIPQSWEAFLGDVYWVIMENRIAADKEQLSERSLKVVEQFETIVKEHCEHILFATGQHYPWDWKFVVSPESAVNAYTFPGGKIVMNLGSLQILVQNGVLNENELAAILAHEFGHAVARHTAEVVSLVMPINLLFVMLTNALGTSADTAFDLLVSLPQSRRNEREADLMGIKMMAIAGYDPEYAISIHKRFLELESGDAKFAYTSTHPLETERLKFLERYLPEARELYEKSKFTPPIMIKKPAQKKSGWFS